MDRTLEPVAYRFKVEHEYGWSDWAIVKEAGDLEAYRRDRPQKVLIEPLYTDIPGTMEALRGLVDKILDYERVNNLSPNPGKKYCWDSVERAVEVISKAEGRP